MAIIDARDAHPHERHDRQPDPRRVDIGTIAGDYMRILKLAHPLDDGRRRQPDASA